MTQQSALGTSSFDVVALLGLATVYLWMRLNRVSVRDVGERAALTVTGSTGDDTFNLNTSLALGSATSSGDLTVNVEHINISAASIGTDGGTDAGSVSITGATTIGADLAIDTDSAAGNDGSVTFTGIDVRQASESDMRALRGREMSMIFQNPRAALNPIRKVGRQIVDVLRQHAQADASQLAEKAIAHRVR